MVPQTIRYEGDLHCHAVHEPSGSVLATDAPKDNQGRGEAFSPTDLVATALASCILTTMAIVGRRDGIEIAGATARITKEMTTAGPRRIARLAVDVDLPLPRSADPKGVLERAARACPVHHSLHPDVAIALAFRWRE